MIRKLFVNMIFKSDYHLFSKVAYNMGYHNALREVRDIVRNAKYPEYLEEDLIEYLNEKGFKP